MRVATLFLVCLVGVGLTASAAMGDEAEALFIRANDLYQKGDYASALAEYEKIHQLGYQSWELLYNMGNACYKQGQIGRAILFYERAKKLNPKQEDVNFNLALANLAVVDRIPEMPRLFFVTWIDKLAHLAATEVMVAGALVLYGVLMGLLILRILRRPTGGPALLSGLAALLAVLVALTAYRLYLETTTRYAIVLAQKVEVRSAPDETSTEVFTLHEGVKVQIQDATGRWARIRLADGKVGWLKRETVEEI